MRYEVRQARADDGDWAYDLHREAMGSVVEQVFGPWDEAVQRPMHDAWFDPHRLRVIEVSGNRVGILDLQEQSDHHYLARIEVAHGCRGKGLGRAVLADLLHRADEAGLPIRLDVFSVNPARGLYERLGFREVGQEGSKVRMERPPQQR